MRLSHRLILVVALLAGTAFPAVLARAADPASGTISSSARQVKWSGTIANGAPAYYASAGDDRVPCQTPSCDSFKVTLAEPGDMTIALVTEATGANGAEAALKLRITKPDGTVVSVVGHSSKKTPFVIPVRKAVKGDYVLDVFDQFVNVTDTYTGTATFGLGDPNATPTPAPVPTRTPAPGSEPTPPPGAPGLSIEDSGASARKLNRAHRLRVHLVADGPLTQVRVTLARGRSQLAQGVVAQLSGAGTVTLRLKRRLRPGRYSLAAGGYDAAGRSSVGAAEFRITR